MEHLTKQQIVLLTLLVSFVTSIATGIVTVALMDQAPVGVTSTINHIIERTVEQVTPASTGDANQATVIGSGIIGTDPQNQISTAVSVVQKSAVVIKSVTGKDAAGRLVGSTTGMGIVVSKSGVIATDKAAVAVFGSYIAVFPNGVAYPVQITQSQNNGDLVFLTVQSDPNKKVTFSPVVAAQAPLRLGQTVLSLSGGDVPTIAQGIVTKVNAADSTSAASSTPVSFDTNIDYSKATTENILFNTSGQVMAIVLPSGTSYPLTLIQSAIAIH